MNERLKELVERYMIRAGGNAAAKLSIAAKCSQRLIYDVKNNGHIPKPDTAYRLAKVCGLNEQEALDLARQCSPGAKRTA